jgi:hypothetical protein
MERSAYAAIPVAQRAGLRVFWSSSDRAASHSRPVRTRQIDAWYDNAYPEDLADPQQEAHDRWVASLPRDETQRFPVGFKTLMER